MTNLFKRIKNRYIMTINNIENDIYFSKKLAVFRFIDDIGGRIGLNKLSNWAHSKKEEFILTYLKTSIKDVIEKYVTRNDLGVRSDNPPIWVCWWDGEEQAPILVRKCIESIKKNASNHTVIIITKYNYLDYLEIPNHILDRLYNKKMKLAHFADYLRVCLLEKYGGLWLDSTIFCSNNIPEDYFTVPFFTCKSEIKKGHFISDFQWTTFCLGGWKNNVFYKFMKEAFEVYWQNEKYAIDYLFFDDLIYLAKNNIPAINELLQRVPLNNIHRDDLQAAMNDRVYYENVKEIINQDTCFYKLSWRETYFETTIDGRESIYGFFIKQ